MPQDWFKCFRKKEEILPFSSATARRKKPKKSFSLYWAENLAESDQGSYFDQEQWLNKLNEQPSAECHPSVSTFSASRLKITVEEPLAGLESENTETRQKLHGHDSRRRSTNQLFVAFVKEALNLWKTYAGKNGLGSTCECFSARTKAVRRTKLIAHFRRGKKAG